ncbi:fibronectin type III domain-containing protein, partial [Mesonia mobilis]|uniref:fibronectin type III domain-containing protein n=1 Tax=Mesonia mobilis TaxID=369791 RepID=UPI0026EBB98A
MRKITLLFYLLIPLLGFSQILNEDFEGTLGANGLPTGWTETGLSTDGIWSVGDATAASSLDFSFGTHTNFAYTNDDFCNCDKSADRLIMPVLDFTTLTTPRLTYSVFYEETETVTIEVSTDGGTTWTTEATLSSATGWRNGEFLDLPAYGGQSNVLISFLYNDNGNWVYGLGIDDVSVDEAPSCLSPTNLSAANITDTSADISWTAGNTETEWEVLYGISGFDTETEGTSVTVDNGVPSLNLDDLETAALYDIYVRAICSDDDASLWSFAIFSTRPENDDCDNAIELQLNEGLECTVVNSATNVGATASSQEDNITGTPNNDVWFTFTATSASHPISLSNIEAIIGTSTDMAMALYDGTEGCEILTLVDDSDPNSFTATGLTVGNTYYLRVYGYSANNSAQTSFDVCIQTIQCPVPMELSIGGFTTSSADVTWVAGGSETEW